MSEGKAVSTKRLTKVYGRTFREGADHVAVADLDLDVDLGDIFGFLGPNGAGKTTTLRILTGVLGATSGEAHVLSVDVGREPERVKAMVSYLPQGEVLYGDLTAVENVRFVLSLYGIPRHERHGLARQTLSLFDLEPLASRRASQLSGGQRRLLALCCAVAPRQRLLILDEPTAGLDPEKRALVWDVLHRLQVAGTTVFVTTHQMDEADRCRHLGLMSAGRLLTRGSPEELKAGFAQRIYEASYGGKHPEDAEVARAFPSARLSVRGSRLRIATDLASEGEVAARLDAIGPSARSVRVAEPDLEDVFLAASHGVGSRLPW